MWQNHRTTRGTKKTEYASTDGGIYDLEKAFNFKCPENQALTYFKLDFRDGYTTSRTDDIRAIYTCRPFPDSGYGSFKHANALTTHSEPFDHWYVKYLEWQKEHTEKPCYNTKSVVLGGITLKTQREGGDHHGHLFYRFQCRKAPRKMMCCEKSVREEIIDEYIQILHNLPIDCGNDGFVSSFRYYQDYYNYQGWGGWVYRCAFFSEMKKPAGCGVVKAC